MSYQALINTPIQVNLLTAANDTGWTEDGVNAYHSSCNSGLITLFNYPVKGGTQYEVSYIILSISGGNVQPQSPGGNGIAQTAPGVIVDVLSPSADGFISFYSNANCEITAFNIKPISTAPGVTIVYATENRKWSDFRQFYPDFGWSLYTRTIFANNGALHASDNGELTGSTNNFFGNQFQSSIKFVEAKNPAVIKDFEALSYQANNLMVTTIDGIVSSLGQISTLIDTDFIKTKLAAGGLSVTGYQNDGVYSASFLGDQNEDGIVNGASMRGGFIIIELITNDGSTPFTLFSVAVRSRYVPIGSR